VLDSVSVSELTERIGEDRVKTDEVAGGKLSVKLEVLDPKTASAVVPLLVEETSTYEDNDAVKDSSVEGEIV
jgi:hypothetical protein